MVGEKYQTIEYIDGGRIDYVGGEGDNDMVGDDDNNNGGGKDIKNKMERIVIVMVV